MKNQKIPGLLLLILLLAAAGAGIAFQVNKSGPGQPGPLTRLEPVQSEASQSTGLRKVDDVKKVCMVNNQFMGKDQIPVKVEGKTYYGCCEMCKERIAKDPAVRYSTDPVSGARVDKATAVIGALPDGTTIYFESEANLEAYSSKPRS